MAEIGSFKSKIFGGFDRKDVVNYIEKLAAERNKYKQQCSELEEEIRLKKEKISQLEEEIEANSAKYKRKLQEKTDEIVADYEKKLLETEAALACAKIEAQDKRAAEKDEALEAVSEASEKFAQAGSDAQLLCARISQDLKELTEKIDALPDVVESSHSRLEDIKEKLK